MGLKKTTVLLAAGGTGGHVIPALALADELHARGIGVIFATDARGIKYVTDRPWMTTRVIRAGTIRKQPIRLIKDMMSLCIGIIQSWDIIRDNSPNVVVGFGGYPCFPPVFAAQFVGIPTMLHEQNAVMGKANVWLSKLCTRIALSLPDYTGLSDAQRKRTIVTGRPVHAKIDDLYNEKFVAPQNTEPFHILITGGSQGAAILGTALPPVFAALPDHLRARLNLTHQVIAADVDAVKSIYKNAGITATVAPFITDIPDRLATTHLFIGRSGGTVTEMCVAGIPAIYIPYPHHKDQQQLKNAQVVVNAGGAVIVQEQWFDPITFAALLTDLLQNPEKLQQMANSAKTCGRPHAARFLADAALTLCE